MLRTTSSSALCNSSGRGDRNTVGTRTTPKVGWRVNVLVRSGDIDDQERISALLTEITGLDLIVTTGGTGIALRDVTPEATAAVSHRKIDGFGELMRLKGSEKTRFAYLSRGGAFTRGEVLIVNLPGSPKGAVESLEAVAGLIPHVVDLLHGRTEHGA